MVIQQDSPLVNESPLLTVKTALTFHVGLCPITNFNPFLIISAAGRNQFLIYYA